jgi:hypothetical protein
MAEGAQRGIFMTTGLYSRDAFEFVVGKPIELLGRSDVEDLMAFMAHSAQNLRDVRSWIDEAATRSDWKVLAAAHIRTAAGNGSRGWSRCKRSPTRVRKYLPCLPGRVACNFASFWGEQ